MKRAFTVVMFLCWSVSIFAQVNGKYVPYGATHKLNTGTNQQKYSPYGYSQQGTEKQNSQADTLKRPWRQQREKLDQKGVGNEQSTSIETQKLDQSNQSRNTPAAISDNNVSESTSTVIKSKLVEDIDRDIPQTKKTKPDTYVLAIGNEDYSTYQIGLEKEANVPFAVRDAEIFSAYCEKTLGVPHVNIISLKNATLGQMGQGIAKLEKLAEIRKGAAELIFYYAGHGLPDEETKESYLIPVDINGSNLTVGVSLNDLYKRLGKYPTKRVTVFLDACFSGGSRNGQLVSLRGVHIKPKEESVATNMVVFASSSGTESSAAYKEKEHGMFTYFILKKWMESKGDLSYKEMSDYLEQQVLKQSVLINNKEQTPQVKVGSAATALWGDWKF